MAGIGNQWTCRVTGRFGGGLVEQAWGDAVVWYGDGLEAIPHHLML